MRKFNQKYTIEQLKYLSLSFNSPLVLELPNLPENVVRELLKIHLKEIAFQMLHKVNQATHTNKRTANIIINEAEALTIISANTIGTFQHFGDYETYLLSLLIDKAIQHQNIF